MIIKLLSINDSQILNTLKFKLVELSKTNEINL